MTNDTPSGAPPEETSARSGPGSTDKSTVTKAQRGTRLLLEAVGEDPTADGLRETWQRRVPATLAELTAGYCPAAKPTMRTFEAHSEDLVVKTDIPVYSLCEHHLLPYFGRAHLAYRPAGAVVGLSKLVRFVRWRSRRLTMQEQLTTDIADGLAEELGSDAVLVELAAVHLCEAMRGIETRTETRTTASAGSPTETEWDQFHSAVARTPARSTAPALGTLAGPR